MAALSGVALALGAAGCLAPRPGDEVTLGEVGRMLGEGAVAPVQGTVEDGRIEPPETDPFALVDPAAVADVPAPPQPAQEEPRENPYIRFGERILVREVDGREVITKPYPLPVGKGPGMVILIRTMQPFPYKVLKTEEVEAQEGPPDPEVAELVVLENWDKEVYSNLVATPPVAGAAVEISDWLVVTAGYDLLDEVEDFIDLFAASVRQIEIQAKIIEVIETDSLDVGVQPIGGQPIFDFPDGTFVDSLDFSFPNAADVTEGLLSLGAVQDGLAFNALIEALAAYDNVSIETRPRVITREGGLAVIESTEEIPFINIAGINQAGNFTSNLQYKEVGSKLYAVPRVVGTDTLALDLNLEASQRTGSASVFVIAGAADDPASQIVVPTLASRKARTVVYLRPGQTLVIGGLTSERIEQRERKVPILGDLPILGLLFRSKFESVQRVHTLFAISPRIVQGTDFQAEL